MSLIYRSIRIGQYEKPFTLLKIRTMVEGADRKGGPSTSADDPRITRIGWWLRKYKIDELPQIWNIIKGDLSFVGPRPEVKEVIDLLTIKERDIILSVKPGLVDLATLANMNEEERLRGESDPHQAYLKKIWPEKKKLQIEYVQTKSLRLDLKIIWEVTKRLLRQFVKR